MNERLIPKKNHKAFLAEMCKLFKAYHEIKNLRNKDEISTMLVEHLPKILNNFDRSSPDYKAVETILFGIFEDIGVVIKFIKE